LAAPMIQQGEDPFECINKAMAFLSAIASWFPPSDNNIRTSSNPRNQVTIQDAGQPRVVKCYNCQGERHMARQCTQPKSLKNTAWFKEILMLAKTHEADLDAYDSNCDDLSLAKTVMMANLSSCDPEVLSEVPYSDYCPNDMINQDVQEMQYSKQTRINDFQDNEIHSDSNIIPVIAKEHVVISMFDDEETLILEEEGRSKVLDKQNDPISIKKKIKISPIDYSKLNKIKEDFGKRFVTKKELSTEQAFWLKHSSFSETPVTSYTPVRIEAPSELPKVSLVNESLKKLKYQLANFDNVVKKRTTSDAITAGARGFEHTKACFVTEIILFLKVLKDTFNAFDKTLLDEITEVQTVFNQMEAVVDQCSIDKNVFEIQIKHQIIDNDQLLTQIMSQESVHITINSVNSFDVKKSYVNECNKCLEIETELLKKKDLIEKDVYDKLLKSYSTLKKHCISLELTTQLNQEVFQKDNLCENQNAPTFNQLFELNKLKAQSQKKDTVIRKLKDRIKSLSEKDSLENVKKDIDEIETINIELEHKHYDSLIAQINAKSVENSDLNAQLQEKVFANAALKNELRKLKGENVVDTAVLKPNATIAPGMFKLDIEPISPRLKNNKDAYEVYIEKTIEYTDTLHRFVEHARTQYPTEPLLESACMFTKHVQELLVYASQTCHNSPKPSEKLVAVTPINKDKRVRFVEPVTSLNSIPKQTDSLKTKYSNKPLLTSTGVKPTTSASRSKPSSNTKNNRIT
ncbi:retrovirus-related pol polyprotein from transposon TNT 1-94, partial [Tanacetum coccineum]